MKNSRKPLFKGQNKWELNNCLGLSVISICLPNLQKLDISKGQTTFVNCNKVIKYWMNVVDWWDCFKDDWNEVYNTLVYYVVGRYYALVL